MRRAGAASRREPDFELALADGRPGDPHGKGLKTMREVLVEQMRDAMKAGAKIRVGALRLIIAALKDREIEMRGSGKIVSRADELAVLTKMVKSRQESAAIYEQAGRQELADQEKAENAVIGGVLAKQMDGDASR